MSREEMAISIISLALVVFGWILTTKQNNKVHRHSLNDAFCDTVKGFLVFIQDIIEEPDGLNISKITIKLELLRVDSKRINTRGTNKKILPEIDAIEELFDSEENQELVSVKSLKQDNSNLKSYLLMDIGYQINYIISLTH